jgi:molybdopterin-guanine dinucleotide biosynthesis protein A
MAGVSGILLAGGRSRRMGRDKAALLMGGEPLVQRTARALSAVADEVVLVRGPHQSLPPLECDRPVVEVADLVEGEGPLFGLATGLEVARYDMAIVVGVDMPFLQPALLELLAARLAEVRPAGSRWVLPIAERRPQPLCSAFARDALDAIRARLDAGDRAPMVLAADLKMVRLAEEDWRAVDPNGLSFIDVDTPEDFDAALLRYERLRGAG